MITLLPRKAILETKKIIGSELTKIQEAVYDEDTLQIYISDNEKHLYLEMFDCVGNEIGHYKTYNKILGLNHADINSFTTILSHELTKLFQVINANEFYLLSHIKQDFFGNRDNKFKPLVNAYKNLEKITGQKNYKEAFTFDLNSLPDFIDIIFWLTRCDPGVAEYIFLFDKNEKIQIHLCKYGNIHLTEFGNELLSDELLAELGWTIIEGAEYDNFTDEARIEGREIKL